ncbi:MAG: ABC transporter ATP-binding protein [Candidatus Falkowbacteria bacterium]|nr:ABC transporter ATP-binding protein [Candidatus Falkowbacteria bacterium]
MHTIDKDIERSKVREVAKAFWRAIRLQKLGFYTTVFCFTISAVLSVFIPLYDKRFFDALTSGGVKTDLAPTLISIIISILIIHSAYWLLFRFGMVILSQFESKVMARLKQMAFEHVIHHSYGFFSNTFTGSLVQRINRFSRAFERLYDTFVFNFIPLLVQVIGTIIIVYFQEKIIAFIIVIWVVVTMLCNYFFSRWKVKYDIASAAADSATTALLADSMTNQYAVSSFVGSDYEAVSFKEVSNKQADATALSWQLSNAMDAVQGALWVAVEFFVFYFAIRFWQMNLISVGTFVLVQIYIIGLAQRLWDFGRIIRNVYEGYADSSEMVLTLNLPHEVKDTKNAKSLVVKKSNIIFDNVSFAFSKERPILKSISLSITGGEKIALVGPSGAGKSTIVRLIMRLYNLKQGTITIDGQDIQKVTLASLRSAISIVPQDPVLFHRSLLENIRYGRREATNEEVVAAARLAHCDEFIEQLPLKYETLVGERGIKLSGGERQRVAIARAILKNAPVLILDEATSSLDSHSELLIQDALDELMKNKTTIVIAHRLSTIRKMDRIIVLDEGSITEEGTHEDLLKKDKGLYRHLWELQAGGFLRM